jgi:adenylosuccinate synthase
VVTEMPGHVTDFERCRPVYETLPGWTDDLTAVRQWSELPTAARSFVRFLAKQVGVPVRTVSVGPERKQTITGVDRDAADA